MVKMKNHYADLSQYTQVRVGYNFPNYQGSGKGGEGKLMWSTNVAQYSYLDTSGLRPQSITQNIFRQTLTIYNNLWFDLQSIYWLFGETQTIYKSGPI